MTPAAQMGSMGSMADRDLDVVVVGAIGVDTNVYVPDGPLDDTDAVFVSVLDVVGQAGGFTARGFAALGRRTAFAGHVGADPWGVMVHDALAADGIDSSSLSRDDPAGTARSVNLVGTDGRRQAFYDGRGAGDFAPDLEAAASVIGRARLAMVHLPNWTRRLIPVARSQGTTVAVDLQDVHDIDDPYRADFIAGAELLFASAADHGDPLALATALLERSPARVVVVGAGGEGAVLATRDGPVRLVPPAPLDLPVVDTNGAGDALAVGFCDAFVLDGLDAERALRRGQLAARWACAQRGRSDTLITRPDLDRLERA